LWNAAVDFRGIDRYTKDDVDGALIVVARIPPAEQTNAGAQLLLKIRLEQNDPAALALARRTDCWDLRNGKHWQYLAQAEERWGTLDAARAAWRRAVFYYPDDDELMSTASAFAVRHNDAELAQQITDTVKLWSAP
jgi:predicted Zn-dependent protease